MQLEDAEKIAYALLQEEVLEDWTFRFDGAKKRFGMCNYEKKEISLSRYLVDLNSEEKVRDTIIHEIAHAIVGYKAGHGKDWKRCVMRMGGVPERCYSSQEVNTPQLKYTLFCKSCSIEIQRNSLPKTSFLRSLPACKSCCKKYNAGKYSKKFELHWRQN